MATARTRAPAWVAPLQALVENPLPRASAGRFIGLIGDHPSTYARSPRIWKPALASLHIDAAYVALDVRADRLPSLVQVLRDGEACLGANVTVPYKEAITPLLDGLDPSARPLGAVNTIVRTPDGRLIGANTDGAGLVAALLEPSEDGPLLEGLEGATVLLIGAGGAARAAAVALAPLLGSGALLVTNRTIKRARATVAAASKSGARATAVSDADLERSLPAVTLMINASLRGQAGILKDAQGTSKERWAHLDPYSALAPASPARLAPMPEERFLAAWSAASADDIAANHARSRARMHLLPPAAVVYDMVYAPPETVTLAHAREAGLRGANGRGMNIAQAVAACVDHICRRHLAERGIDPRDASAQITRIMTGAWDG